MLVVFNLFQTVGFYGFSNWVPTLLMKQGVAFTASLEYTFVIAIAAPFGPLLAWVLSDRMERKWLIVGSLGVWSGVTLIMGTAHDFSTLLWLRRAMGVSEAFYIPAGLSLIADYHRGATRSLARPSTASGAGSR